MPKSPQRECLHCKELFDPHPRNRHHQKFCSETPCRNASKAASQRRWSSQPANQHHFRGWENVFRVQQWRKKNPGYWKRHRKTPSTLQDVLKSQPLLPEQVAPKTSSPPLQDFLAAQDPLLLGLISHLIDSPLQDQIEQTTFHLLRMGRTFLDLRSGIKTKENHENQKTNPLSGTAPPYLTRRSRKRTRKL